MNSKLIYRMLALIPVAKRLVQNHPKQLLSILSACMLTAGGAAYAVATIAPDPAELPVRNILESVQPLAVEPQLTSLTSSSFKLFRSEVTRSNDTLDSLFKRLGIDDIEAASALRNHPIVHQHLVGRSGRNVTAETTEGNKLLQITSRWTSDDSGNFHRLVLAHTGKDYAVRLETAPLVTSTRLASGTIQSSLFAATDEAQIPDSVAIQLAEIFSSDIDFHRSLRKGDHFSVVYETLRGDDEPLRSGRVLSAEFVNNGKTFQAMWFRDPSATSGPAKGAYYTLSGQSLRRAYLTSPVEFSRVTSGFGTRLHPVTKTLRAHVGVDYAAPIGTPARSVGDGVVEFSGVQRGYGNVVIIKHRNNHSTLYGHLSRIDVRQNEHVSQGQNIGAVGVTGISTGPHLHFEFRIDGVHHDPLTIARENESIPVSASGKAAFEALSSATQRLLSAGALMTTNTQ